MRNFLAGVIRILGRLASRHKTRFLEIRREERRFEQSSEAYARHSAEKLSNAIRPLCKKRLRDSMDIEEAVQETFLRLLDAKRCSRKGEEGFDSDLAYALD